MLSQTKFLTPAHMYHPLFSRYVKLEQELETTQYIWAFGKDQDSVAYAKHAIAFFAGNQEQCHVPDLTCAPSSNTV